jgi:hypothetical protein
MNVQPRELKQHYKDTRARLWGPPPKRQTYRAPPKPVEPARPIAWVFEPVRPAFKVAFLTAPAKFPISVNSILRAVAAFFGLSVLELISARRDQNLVDARHIAMHLAKTLAGRSLPHIGRRMGGRDHTTVLHGARKVERALADPNSPLHGKIANIRAILEA